MAKTFITRVELTHSSELLLKTTSRENAMTQVALLSRLVQWFAQQPASIQAAVLGSYPEAVAADIARLILKHMGEQAEPAKSSAKAVSTAV